MKIRHTLATALTAASLACSPATENDPTPPIDVPVVMPAAVAGSVTIGNAVTVSDVGWKSTFGGTVDVSADVTVIYAFVFGGSGGSAPVSGVSVGSQPLTKVKSATGPSLSSMDVYRLIAPGVGSGKAIVVTRAGTGYDPVRVTVLTVIGAGVVDPNGPMTTVDITPGTAVATRTTSISSSAGALTLSAVVASPSYVNATGVTATPGYQTVAASGEDADGAFGVIGSAPGAASVTHSWNLRADAAGRYAFLVSFSVNAGSAPPAVVVPPPSAGSATFGTVVTLSDAGWLSPFSGTINVESDATVVYAVVFNGSGGNAPISDVSVGGRSLTRIKSAQRTANASLDVFRLVGPASGPQAIAVSRTRLAYDPVRVSVFTVRGANSTTPNGDVTEVDLTPASATATRSVTVLSSSDGLTITAVAAAATYLNGTGVAATPGFQVTRASGEDADGVWGVLGSAPGAASVTHSYDLKADVAARYAYLVSFSVNGASGAPAAPAPPPTQVLPPAPSAGWTTVLDYDVAQAPPLEPASYLGWTAYQRTSEQMLFSNLSLIQDPSQPGSGSSGAERIQFLTSLPGGYAPINLGWGGTWPANDGSLDLTFTIKLSANWDNNGSQGTNDGVKTFFFGRTRQNNHVITLGSRRYDGAAGGGTGALGGAWVTVSLQNPTVSYKTSVDLTRDAWHTVRVQIVANTPGTANGQLRVWVDGATALLNTGANNAPVYDARTNVVFYSSGQTARQDRLDLEPTYTGYESPPYTQWFDIGHVTAAVK